MQFSPFLTTEDSNQFKSVGVQPCRATSANRSPPRASPRTNGMQFRKLPPCQLRDFGPHTTHLRQVLDAVGVDVPDVREHPGPGRAGLGPFGHPDRFPDAAPDQLDPLARAELLPQIDRRVDNVRPVKHPLDAGTREREGKKDSG